MIMTPLEREVDQYCRTRLGRPPELRSPQSYNDKIQWLKLNDQMPEMVTACDKRMVRSMIPTEFLIPEATGYPRVIKCSHDSGSVAVCRSAREEKAAERRFSRRLRHHYGIGSGEWAYRMIKNPCIVREALIPGGDVDYKFHCVHGRVAWMQVIWNRSAGAIECILSPDAEQTGLHMDEKMRHSSVCPHTPNWRALSDVAEYLAQPYRYVRVDLYWSNNAVMFGELTFWPRGGGYMSPHPEQFNAMMDIDMSYSLPRIIE